MPWSESRQVAVTESLGLQIPSQRMGRDLSSEHAFSQIHDRCSSTMLGEYIIPKSVKSVDATRVPVLAAAFKPFRLISCWFSFDRWLLSVPQLSVRVWGFFVNRFVQLICIF